MLTLGAMDKVEIIGFKTRSKFTKPAELPFPAISP